MIVMENARYTKQVIPNEYFPNRKEVKTDVQAFAKDLAKALGGGSLIPNKESYDKDSFASFMLGADLISVSGNRYGSKGKVTVHISAPDVPWGEYSSYAKDQKVSEASINPEARSIEAIAKDIKKRVIDASQAALAAQRAYKAMRNESRSQLSKNVEALSKAGFDVRAESDGLSARLSSGPDKFYFYGSLGSDGSVSISSLGSLSIEKFLKVMEVLNG